MLFCGNICGPWIKNSDQTSFWDNTNTYWLIFPDIWQLQQWLAGNKRITMFNCTSKVWRHQGAYLLIFLCTNYLACPTTAFGPPGRCWWLRWCTTRWSARWTGTKQRQRMCVGTRGGIDRAEKKPAPARGKRASGSGPEPEQRWGRRWTSSTCSPYPRYFRNVGSKSF